MALSLLEIRRKILIYLNDLEDETLATGDRFDSVVQINSVINDTIRYYANQLDSFYQGYLSTDYTLNALANTRIYALPANFRTPIYKIKRTINTYEYTLNKKEDYITVRDTTSVDNLSWLPAYWIEGRNILFDSAPINAENGAMIIKFAKKITLLSLDVSTLDEELYDAEDCIIIRSVIRLLRSRDVSGALKNVDGWKNELQDAETNFYQQVGKRYVAPERTNATPNLGYWTLGF